MFVDLFITYKLYKAAMVINWFVSHTLCLSVSLQINTLVISNAYCDLPLLFVVLVSVALESIVFMSPQSESSVVRVPLSECSVVRVPAVRILEDGYRIPNSLAPTPGLHVASSTVRC